MTIIKDIENSIKKLDEIIEISSRPGNSYLEKAVWKKVEDGILDNIHNADSFQLTKMLTTYKFRYYTEYNNKEVLRSEIQRRVRLNNLDKILK